MYNDFKVLGLINVNPNILNVFDKDGISMSLKDVNGIFELMINLIFSYYAITQAVNANASARIKFGWIYLILYFRTGYHY